MGALSYPVKTIGVLGPEMNSGGETDMNVPESRRTETARYIADMTQEMSLMAKHADLEIIAYLLELARLEAEETAQKDDLT